MHELLLFSVVGASLTVMAGVWIHLHMDNIRQEKLIKKYHRDLSSSEKQGNLK